jgi:hypothetical protein
VTVVRCQLSENGKPIKENSLAPKEPTSFYVTCGGKDRVDFGKWLAENDQAIRFRKTKKNFKSVIPLNFANTLLSFAFII